MMPFGGMYGHVKRVLFRALGLNESSGPLLGFFSVWSTLTTGLHTRCVPYSERWRWEIDDSEKGEQGKSSRRTKNEE